MKKGLMLVAFGIISVWLFGMLGETDITGPALAIILGTCQVGVSVHRYVRIIIKRSLRRRNKNCIRSDVA